MHIFITSLVIYVKPTENCVISQGLSVLNWKSVDRRKSLFISRYISDKRRKIIERNKKPGVKEDVEL